MRNKTVPIRQCVGCREKKNKSELIRIVKTPEGEIMTDLTGKKNGRGMYICRNADCLSLAKKKRIFEQSFGPTFSNGIYDNLKKELALLDEE